MSNPADMTLEEHAEAWTREQNMPVPPRGTPEHDAMYAAWVDRAFADFAPQEDAQP